MGASAGGILIGNAMVERPDLYRVIIPDVGWTDALGSAQRDPNGPINWPEFGNPTEADGYRAMPTMRSYQKSKDRPEKSEGRRDGDNVVSTGHNCWRPTQ